jgi:hypothetical protein
MEWALARGPYKSHLREFRRPSGLGSHDQTLPKFSISRIEILNCTLTPTRCNKEIYRLELSLLFLMGHSPSCALANLHRA